MILGCVVIGALLLLVLFGVPVTMSIGAASVFGLWLAGFADNLMIVPQQVLDGVDSPALLAIPFFILAGALMNTIGLTDRIFVFALALVGHFRAGLAHVNVLASLVFAGISGSATADIAGLGQIEVDAMRKRGYTVDFAAALSVATSMIGPIIPPSISLIVYAWLSNTSIARLFLAGIVPGLLVAAAFMIYIRTIASFRAFPREPRATLGELGRAMVQGVPALVGPGVILGSIIFGFATATEAGVVACVYSLILGVCYRSLTIGRLWLALTETMMITSYVLMLIGLSQIMGWVFAVEQVPQGFVHGLAASIDGRAAFLAFVILFLLVVGLFIEATPAKIILLPLLLPMADAFDVDRIQFGLVITLALLMGLATPPVGVGLYVMSPIARISVERLSIAILPMLLAPLGVLILIAVFPSLTLWLPQLILGDP